MVYILVGAGVLLLLVGLVLFVKSGAWKDPAKLGGGKAGGHVEGPASLILIVIGGAMLVGGIVLERREGGGSSGQPIEVATNTLAPGSGMKDPPGPEPVIVDPVRPPVQPDEQEATTTAKEGPIKAPRRTGGTTTAGIGRPPTPGSSGDVKPPPEEPKPLPVDKKALEAPATQPIKEEPPPVDPALVQKIAAKRQRYSEVLWSTPQDQETAAKYAALMRDLIASRDPALACKAVDDWRRYAAANCQWVSIDVLNQVAPHITAINQQCGAKSLDRAELMRCAK